MDPDQDPAFHFILVLVLDAVPALDPVMGPAYSKTRLKNLQTSCRFLCNKGWIRPCQKVLDTTVSGSTTL